MLSIAERIILAGGWSRRLIAFVAGAFGALAMAPVDFIPAAIVPLTVAVWLIDGAAEAAPARRGRFASAASLRSAFDSGWWWGFGYFVAGLWWLGAAFLVDPDFAWALPLGVVVVPALLAVFPAIGFVAARLLWAPGAGRLFALAAALGLTEWLRGHLFTGFPWNEWGMVLGGNDVTGQLAALVGLYGLNVVVVLVFATPALAWDAALAGGGWRVRPIIAVAATLVAIAGFGLGRLASGHPGVVAGVHIRIMQPNLAQDAKFAPENGPAILKHYLDLSDRATGPAHTGLADVTLLVWPESAFPFILSRTPQALAEIGAMLPPKTTLVTGAARREDGGPSGSGAHYFNAIQVVGGGGIILDSYDKVHLVPFGEYLPFDSILKRLGLHHFVRIPGGFEAGVVHRLIDIPGLPPAVPLICYEVIFPGDVVPPHAPGKSPGLMLNVTNDAWFGRTPGPYQHLAQARLQSIEEGLPLVRAANTGISAIVDPYGRIVKQLSLGTEGVLDGPLPQKIDPPLVARFPFGAPALLWLLSLVVAVVVRCRV